MCTGLAGKFDCACTPPVASSAAAMAATANRLTMPFLPLLMRASRAMVSYRTPKKLRIAGIVGTEPYYHKDIVTGQWSGFCVSMATDLAKALEAEVEIIESTWGNSVLDLQSNKIDIMFGLSPTPSRATAQPMLREHTFGIATWDTSSWAICCGPSMDASLASSFASGFSLLLE